MKRFILVTISIIFSFIVYAGNNKNIAEASSSKESQGYFCDFAYTEEEAPECFWI